MPPQLSRNFLKDSVLTYLRTEIISGRLAPEIHLAEAKLAEMMGVSRGPIRDALQVLEQEGLVETPRNGRTRVIGLTVRDVEDLYTVRTELELLAISQAVRRGADVAPLLQVVEQFRAVDKAGPEAAHLDLEFHHQLVRLSQNRPLAMTWLNLSPTVHALLSITNSATADFERIGQEHRTVLAAIENGQIEQAQEVLGEHLGLARQLMVARLQTVRSESNT